MKRFVVTTAFLVIGILSTPLYAAARLWVDEIIDPALTRKYVSMVIKSANNNPDIPKFNVGVIQT